MEISSESKDNRKPESNFDFLVKMLEKRIEYLQKAVQYIEAGMPDESTSINAKIGREITRLEKRIDYLKNMGKSPV